MKNKLRRQAGIFVPLFALKGQDDQGVGDTRAMKEMIDWCSRHRLSVLQILPINETSGDNSPYNAVSSVALEPTTMSVRPEDVPGLSRELFLKLKERHGLATVEHEIVNYRVLRSFIRDIGLNAMDQLNIDEETAFINFCQEDESWLYDYAMFRALMEQHGGSPVWTKWPEEHKSPQQAVKWHSHLEEQQKSELDRLIRYYSYVQWVLHLQWSDVSLHAAKRKVRIMGDIPFGVSRNSADVWASPDWFNLEWSGGAPPEPQFQDDKFIREWGQNWGIPPYHWDRMEDTDFQWWRRRVRQVARYFNLFRIDHILGFYRLYSFPWIPEKNGDYVDLHPDEVLRQVGHLPQFLPASDETEEGAALNLAQGEKLLKVILEAAGDCVVVGEDLGVVPDYVRPSLEKLGISGFKIPVFERDESSQEFSAVNEYSELTVATLATHDHLSMRALWESWWNDFDQSRIFAEGSKERRQGDQNSWDIYRTQRFLGLPDESMLRDFEPDLREAWIRKLLETPSWLAIFMITDIFGQTLRFNVPGPVADSNWSQRMPASIPEMSESEPYSSIMKFLTKEIRGSGR
ncbi:MAG: 4-alpha-glucanotransferase [Verrucomicrobiota bacterium]